MPPKAEITKEKVLDAAFDIVREEGLEAITARSIAQRLKCSTQPIYSVYGNMEAVKDDVYNKAVHFALSSMKEYKDESNTPALNLAVGFLQVAKNEKQLFRTIYLSGHRKYDLKTEKFIGEEMYTAYLRQRGRLSTAAESKLKKILIRLTIYLVGMGTMINTNTLAFDMNEATEMIEEMYEALLLKEGITKP